MRHAWQFDVIDSVSRFFPTSPSMRLATPFAAYDAQDPVTDSGSELEIDAIDLAADVVGYRGSG